MMRIEKKDNRRIWKQCEQTSRKSRSILSHIGRSSWRVVHHRIRSKRVSIASSGSVQSLEKEISTHHNSNWPLLYAAQSIREVLTSNETQKTYICLALPESTFLPNAVRPPELFHIEAEIALPTIFLQLTSGAFSTTPHRFRSLWL